MYKIGDKFVCIKDNDEYNNYVKGDIIQIIGESKYIISNCVSYLCIYVNAELKESLFDEEIQEYFIPLAEWREMQIKSVIDG